MAISTINQAGLNAPLTLTSPVLTTPNLGTPSALVLTNATGTPVAINLTNATGLPKSALPTGSVLQVINSSATGEISTNTSTFINSGLSVTITPTSSSSRIWITASVNYRNDGGDQKQWGGAIFRNSTNLNSSGYVASSIANSVEGVASFNFIDSPATTSATTYYIKFNNPQGDTARVNPTCCSSGAKYSYMTVLEIAS